jgi:membrane-bound serine protease (ClpP class)
MRRSLQAILAVVVLAAPGPVSARVNVITIDGSINPAVDDFIRESLLTSRDDGAEALVIELDTPGGLLTSAKSIVKEILGAPVPVIVYVAPAGASATSAGVFVTMAAHIAAMAPGTTIGAAHPVEAGGGDVGGDMREKMENFVVSFGQAIAERRGRNVAWAEQAVRQSVSITEKEAVEKHVVDVVAPDLAALLAQAAGREVQIGETTIRLTLGPHTEIVRLDMRLKHRVLAIIADPNVAYLLFMAGLLGLYFEFASPGVVLPGVVGGICLLLALAAFQVLPINSTGILLILFAVSLMIAEAFIPSFGVLGVGGIVAFVLGSLLLFDTPESSIAVERSIVAAAVLTMSGFMLAVGYLVLRSQRRRATTGAEGLVGEIGVVRECGDHDGKVFVHGEYWDVVSDAALKVGDRVEVVCVEKGMRLQVRRAPTRAREEG